MLCDPPVCPRSQLAWRFGANSYIFQFFRYIFLSGRGPPWATDLPPERARYFIGREGDVGQRRRRRRLCGHGCGIRGGLRALEVLSRRFPSAKRKWGGQPFRKMTVLVLVGRPRGEAVIWRGLDALPGQQRRCIGVGEFGDVLLVEIIAPFGQ